MLDKIKGGLFGHAIGDALGGTTEFLTKKEILNQYGGKVTEMIGGGVWNLRRGETTDDTAMTLAVAKGILTNPHEPIEAIGGEFLTWYASRPKDIGGIIRTVFSIYEGDWFKAAEEAHFQYLSERSAGNGTLMRCLPVALGYPDLDKIEAITRKQSRMTHFDPLAEEACLIYNRIAFRVLHGKQLKEAIKGELPETIYASALKGAKPDCPPDGFVVHTMRWVLYWLLECDSFLEVVTGAANEGNDSDTVAAIAGGLAGLACGYDKLPREYCDILEVKRELENLAEGLSGLHNIGAS